MNINALSADALELLGRITKAKITKSTAPIIGDYITVQRAGDEAAERIGNEPQNLPKWLVVAYEAPVESAIIIRIYIGSRYHGPMLCWDGCGWINLYSRGNYGKNYACGGNWAATSKKSYATIAEAVDHRAEDAEGLLCGDQCRLTESAALYDALRAICTCPGGRTSAASAAKEG